MQFDASRAQSLAHLRGAAFNPGRLALPGPFRHAGDHVKFVSAVGEEIYERVPIGTEPLGEIGNLDTFEALDRNGSSMARHAGMDGRFDAGSDFSNPRVETVGADDKIGSGICAIGKPKLHLPACGAQIGELFAEVQDLGIERAAQRHVQIAAVYRHVGRTVTGDGSGSKWQPEQRLAGFEPAAYPGVRFNPWFATYWPTSIRSSTRNALGPR